MKNEGRIVELLAELVFKHDQMIVQQRQTKSELQTMVQEQKAVRNDFTGLAYIAEEENNLLRELGDKIDKLGDMQQRVLKLEDAFFRKGL